MSRTTLILDLDGVLITTPTWRADEIDLDGYSKFNKSCVDNLNNFLSDADFEIWLSSTRRTVKSLAEFNLIFKHRNIKQSIHGFLPDYSDCKTRSEEVLRFIEEHEISDFIIIDDDKSLNDLDLSMKEKLISTELMKGFNGEKLEEAKRKITKHNNS